jgi:hypothetical protein
MNKSADLIQEILRQKESCMRQLQELDQMILRVIEIDSKYTEVVLKGPTPAYAPQVTMEHAP